ncbi:MAG: hypothetical protein HWE07_04060 [Cytophagia bacterium]|nr:hypothetical protein [Cytophagia bacterium]
MPKIAIFENEFELLKDTFDLANLVYYNGDLEFNVFQTSQEFGDIDKIDEYDKILLDIDLAPTSEKDGFGILKEISSYSNIEKVIIITGDSNIETKLDSKGLSKPPILKKPIDVSDLVQYLQL